MARTLDFAPLTLGNIDGVLTGDLLLYTPLGLNIGARKFDAAGNPTGDTVDAGGLLVGYNTTTVVPTGSVAALLGAVTPALLNKNGDSLTDTLRATSGNDIVYWDYATLWDSALLSVPVGLAVLTRFNLPFADQNAAIEVFDLGDGQDILSLVHSNQQFLVSGLLTGPLEYGFAATAYGGGGNDIIWSGNQNDRLQGDAGDDRLSGGGGDDTVFGGSGFDTLEGGDGNDLLIDTENGAIFQGGTGNDVIFVTLSEPATTLAPSGGGEGDDRVYLSGSYASASIDLGGGNDVFLSESTASAGADFVAGGTGNDAISSWSGDDSLSGDDGEDVLWGGAGSDTIVGGAASDYLYVGSGTDTVFGGGGHDYVYFGREDGADNQYWDLARLGNPADGTTNTIVVFGVWAPGEVNGDYLDDAQGVYELDGNVMDNTGGDDMVYVHQVSGTLYRLEMVGGGLAGASMDFDVRDVDTIVLWDNAGLSGQYQQHYQWDGGTDSYVRVL